MKKNNKRQMAHTLIIQQLHSQVNQIFLFYKLNQRSNKVIMRKY